MVVLTELTVFCGIKYFGEIKESGICPNRQEQRQVGVD